MFDNPGNFRDLLRARMGIKPAQGQQSVNGQRAPMNFTPINKGEMPPPAFLPNDPHLNQVYGGYIPHENPITPPYSLPNPTPIGVPKSPIQPMGLPPDVTLPSPTPMGPDGSYNKKSLYRQVF